MCAGPGGVGKTTCAAAIALGAARAGRRACVVTIDPARRLADALGVAGVGSEPVRVSGGSGWAGGGELWAVMLDAKSTFDDVVRRTALSPEQADAILANRIYRNVSGALGGTQEYMAMEEVYALYNDGRFDLIVVDTPPTRHALDFLDAPARLIRFLDNRVFRALMSQTQVGFRLVGGAAQVALRGLSKVVGGKVVSDTVDFFASFEGMEQGFRDRAAAVEALLSDPGTAFVVVAAPRRDAVDEALRFAEQVRSQSLRVAALVVNRVFPDFGPIPAGLDGPPAENLADLHRMASSEGAHVARLADLVPDVPLVRVGLLAGDTHDVDGLSDVATALGF